MPEAKEEKGGWGFLRGSYSKERIALLLLFFLPLALYANSLWNEFVNLDDHWIVLNPQMIEWLTPKGFWATFLDLSKTVRMDHGGEYLPIRDVFAAIQYRCFGDRPLYYHVVQILLFSVSAVLLFRLALRISGRFEAAFLSALLFAVHPLHVESVSWLSGSKDLLSLLFLFLFLDAYERGKEKRGLLYFVLALGSKYHAIIASLFLPFIDRMRWGRIRWKWFAIHVAVGALAFALFSYVGETVRYGHIDIGRSFSGLLRNVLAILDTAVIRLVAPFHLQLFYPYTPAVSWTDLRIWRGVCEVLLLGLLFAKTWKSQGSLVPLGIVIFVTGLIPMGRAPEIHLLADRYLLLSSLGFALILGEGCYWIGDKKHKVAIALPYLVFLAVLTVIQSGVWKSSVSLWEHAARGGKPVHYLVWKNLSLAQRDAGNWRKASWAYRRLVNLSETNDPNLSEYLTDWGRVEIERGNYGKAEDLTRKALAINPKGIATHVNLGVALASQGKRDEAYRVLTNGSTLEPKNIELLFNRTYVALELQRFDDAKQTFAKLEQLAPADPRLAVVRAVLIQQKDSASR